MAGSSFFCKRFYNPAILPLFATPSILLDNSILESSKELSKTMQKSQKWQNGGFVIFLLEILQSRQFATFLKPLLFKTFQWFINPRINGRIHQPLICNPPRKLLA